MNKNKHGGARQGAGRPVIYPDKAKREREWYRITCVLRRDTIQKLKEGADSRFIGEFLQDILDQRGIPSRAEYLARKLNQPIILHQGRRRVPVIVSQPATSRPRGRPPKALVVNGLSARHQSLEKALLALKRQTRLKHALK
jgi:hypothetical protein